MKYDQDTEFTIQIDRYQSKDTGEILSPHKVISDDFEYRKIPINLIVRGSADTDSNSFEDLLDSVELTSIISFEGKDWSDYLSEDEEDYFKYMVASTVATQVGIIND
jgi:hypothetical protein